MMRRFGRKILFGSTMLLLTMAAVPKPGAADDDGNDYAYRRGHDRGDDDDNGGWQRWGGRRGDDGDYYRRQNYRDDRYQGGSWGGYSNRGPDIISGTLDDLSRMRSYDYVDRHERRHFEQARRDLLRFEDNWARGRFDKDRLDGAIENMNHLAHADQVHPRERQILYRDVQQLRDFRANRGRAYRERGPY